MYGVKPLFLYAGALDEAGIGIMAKVITGQLLFSDRFSGISFHLYLL